MKSPGIRLYSESSQQPDNLVLAKLPLVKRIALHLKVRLPPFVEFDDLLQAGMLGLIEASRKFHAEKGIPFDSFARIRIKGAMIDYVRRQSYLPRTAVATRKSHAEATRTLTAVIWPCMGYNIRAQNGDVFATSDGWRRQNAQSAASRSSRPGH